MTTWIGSSGIILKDPHIRAFHRIRNLVELLRMVNELTPQGDEVKVHLITGKAWVPNDRNHARTPRGRPRIPAPDPARMLATPPVGFEPTTGCLEGSCSIQLS